MDKQPRLANFFKGYKEHSACAFNLRGSVKDFFHPAHPLFPFEFGIAEFYLVYFPKIGYILNRGNEMAVKVKPVQPTEIKDKKIAREVIEQIRKPIPASVYKRHEKQAEYIDKAFRK
jgi:hypothetical protein